MIIDNMKLLGTNFTTIAVLAFASALASCALIFPDRIAPKSISYTVAAPGSPWKKMDVTDDPYSTDTLKADLAYENPTTGSIISLNSLCRKYNEHNLDALTNNLVRGIENREVVSKNEVEVDNTKALDTLHKGFVDNVPLNIRTVVLTKKNCTYDFIHVFLPQKENLNKNDFNQFLSSFKVQ